MDRLVDTFLECMKTSLCSPLDFPQAYFLRIHEGEHVFAHWLRLIAAMPNTLAHLAISGLITRAVIKDADVKWIYTACVVPDLPWILQRLLNAVTPSAVAYDLRAYAIAQSSLLMCLLFGLGVSCVFANTRKLLVIFSLGALVHLLLDATQIKLANGVLLFAPLDWQLLRFDWFWPESLWTYLLTAAGLLYFLVHARESLAPAPMALNRHPAQRGAGLLALALWLCLPWALSAWVYDNDNHFISTLSDVPERTGKAIELDRITLVGTQLTPLEGSVAQTAFGERLHLDKTLGKPGDRVSLQGVFTDEQSISVLKHHSHGAGFRNTASMVGLLLVLLTWVVSYARYLLLANRSTH